MKKYLVIAKYKVGRDMAAFYVNGRNREEVISLFKFGHYGDYTPYYIFSPSEYKKAIAKW